MNAKKSNIPVSRRNLLKYGGGFLGTGALVAAISSNLSMPEEVTAQDNLLIAQNKNITPEEALKKLIDGNNRFIEQKRKNPNQTQERLTEVAESQAPFAAILGCADSRVPSEIVFDQGLGDLFVCRVAGNIATSEQIGSLEFGTMVLGAKVIMVMGHSRCGAVKATIEGGRFPGQIGSLVNNIKVGAERAERQPGKNKLESAIKANVMYQVELLNQSSVIGDLIDKKQLKIVGAYYDLDTGKVSVIS